MSDNHRADYSDRGTPVAEHVFIGFNSGMRARGPGRESNNFQAVESPKLKVIEAPSERFGFNPVIQNARMTFSAFVETKFVPEHVEHKTRAGRTHYQAMLKHLIRPETVRRIFDPGNASSARLQAAPDWPYLDQVRLCDLNSEHVRRLVAAAFARNYSWQTVKHIKNVVFAIIAHAQREGCFHGINPASHVKLPPKTRRQTPDLNINETRAILQLLPHPEKHVALFTLSTGMNIQEICKLRWKHVNLAESPRVLDGEFIPPYSIAVRSQWNRAGLGTASPSRNRNIPIPAPLFAVIAAGALEKEPLNPEEFVLRSEEGLPISPAELPSSRLARIGKTLGIPWLSWRVLCRAHVALLSEFRPQLDYMIGHAGLTGASAPARRQAYDIGLFT